MKRIHITRFVIAFVLCLSLFTLGASAVDHNEILNDQAQKSGASGLYSDVPGNARDSLNKLGVSGPDSNSLSKFTPAGIFNYVVGEVTEAAKAPFRAVTAVLGVLLACALLGTMKNAFGEKPLQNVFNIVCTLCIAAVLLVPVSKVIAGATKAVTDSANFMLAFLPVFVGLVTASGHPASAITFQSLLVVVSQTVSQISSTTFAPMVNMYLAFCVIGSVSPGVNIGSIAKFIRKIVDFGLVLCITVFTGLLTVQGLISQAADTVTIKTTKFIVGNFVPVIGGAVSDAVNTVVSCAGLLKTTTGAFAIVVFLLTFLPPILTCLLWMLAVDLSVAIAEMLGIEYITGLLNAVKEALRLLIALVLTVALAMIISVSIMLLLGIGN